MLSKVVEYLVSDPEGTYVDGTLGTGGHARGILENLTPSGKLIGLDVDKKVLETANKNLESFSCRILIRHANYKQLTEICRKENIEMVHGILLDLGLSSFQLNNPDRGFSFSNNGPLDMRMNLENSHTAFYILNSYSEKALVNLFFTYGEEPHSRNIARAIVRFKKEQPLESTDQLFRIISKCVNPQRLMASCARVFQSLRIIVNNELENLKNFLNTGIDCLRPGGRLVIISYHSLEDRLIKNTFRGGCPLKDPITGKELPGTGKWAILTKRPVRPDEKEIQENTRSRSAKLRAAERIG